MISSTMKYSLFNVYKKTYFRLGLASMTISFLVNWPSCCYKSINKSIDLFILIAQLGLCEANANVIEQFNRTSLQCWGEINPPHNM